jgi:hypothetical protein
VQRARFTSLSGFNSATVSEWRTPNSIALRLQGRGDFFYTYVEYCTGRWRAGGDSPGGFATIRDPATGRLQFKGFASGAKVHQWSLRYDPTGHDGSGSITVSMDDQTAICHLDPGHKADGATFNRFGLLNVVKSADGGASYGSTTSPSMGRWNLLTATRTGTSFKTAAPI